MVTGVILSSQSYIYFCIYLCILKAIYPHQYIQFQSPKYTGFILVFTFSAMHKMFIYLVSLLYVTSFLPPVLSCPLGMLPRLNVQALTPILGHVSIQAQEAPPQPAWTLTPHTASSQKKMLSSPYMGSDFPS